MASGFTTNGKPDVPGKHNKQRGPSPPRNAPPCLTRRLWNRLWQPGRRVTARQALSGVTLKARSGVASADDPDLGSCIMPYNPLSEIWRNDALVRRALAGWQCAGRYVDGCFCRKLDSGGYLSDDPRVRLEALKKVPDYLIGAELCGSLTGHQVTKSLQSLCDRDHATDEGPDDHHGGWVLPDDRTVCVFDPCDPDTIPFASLDEKTAELVRRISADRPQEQCTLIGPAKPANGEPTRGLIVTIEGRCVKYYAPRNEKCGRCYRLTAAGIEQARRDSDNSPIVPNGSQTDTQTPARHSPEGTIEARIETGAIEKAKRDCVRSPTAADGSQTDEDILDAESAGGTGLSAQGASAKKRTKRKRARPKRTQPTVEMVRAYKANQAGTSYRAIARECHKSPTTIGKWVGIARSYLESDARSKRVRNKLPEDQRGAISVADDRDAD